MKIIGEKINGTRKRVAQAIAERDADFIKDLARSRITRTLTDAECRQFLHLEQCP